MKNCPECGKRLYREPPENAEYGTPVVDVRHYPDRCPKCGYVL